MREPQFQEAGPVNSDWLNDWCRRKEEFNERDRTDLQVAGEQSGSSGLGQHSDLLERQQVVHMDVVLCKEILPSN